MSAELGLAAPDLLHRCVVSLKAGGSQGTGFLVRRGLVVTCRHVVEGLPLGEVVQASDHSGRQLDATVLATYPAGPDVPATGPERWPDLALLQLPPEGDGLPAVLLDATDPVLGTSLTVGGYPAGAVVTYQTLPFAAASLANYDQLQHRYLLINDEKISPGFSGAPVLTSDGFVWGFVRLDRGQVQGGWVVPISQVLSEAPLLLEAFDDPGDAARPWIELLGAIHIRDFGRGGDGKRFDRQLRPRAIVDIELQRTGQAADPVVEWDVCLQNPAARYPVGTKDLGGGVLEAIGQWTRHRPVLSKEQVELIGGVLHLALMPAHLTAHVERLLGQGEPPLLRLLVSAENRLALLPWEYATSTASTHQRLAIREDLVFSRYVDHDPFVIERAMSRLRVLLVLNASFDPLLVADALEHVGASVTLDGQPVHQDDQRSSRLEVDIRTGVQFMSFSELAHQQGPWHVLHYVGESWGDESLGFVRDYARRDLTLQHTPVAVTTVMSKLQAAGTQAVVLQLTEEHTVTQLDSPNWLSVLTGRVRALVLGEQTTTTDHVTTFATAFYATLLRGQSVETAVQAARRNLSDAPPSTGASSWRDYAAFGNVSVTTTRTGDVLLLLDTGGAEARAEVSWGRAASSPSTHKPEFGRARRPMSPSGESDAFGSRA